MARYKLITDSPEKSDIYLDIVKRYRALLSGIAMVKDDGKTALIKTIAQGDAIFCKRFRHNGIISSIKNQFRRSKAKTSYFNAKEAVRRGIPVPEHVAAAEKYIACFLSDSYLFTRAIKDALPLQRFIKIKFPLEGRYNQAIKQGFIKELAAFIAKVHSSGMIHKDLKGTNIIVSSANTDYSFYVLDLDNALFKANVPDSQIIKNLVQLNNDCMYVSSVFDRLRFLICYFEKSGMKISRGKRRSIAAQIERLTQDKVKRWHNEQKMLERKGKLKHHDDSINLDR